MTTHSSPAPASTPTTAVILGKPPAHRPLWEWPCHSYTGETVRFCLSWQRVFVCTHNQQSPGSSGAKDSPLQKNSSAGNKSCLIIKFKSEASILMVSETSLKHSACQAVLKHSAPYGTVQEQSLSLRNIWSLLWTEHWRCTSVRKTHCRAGLKALCDLGRASCPWGGAQQEHISHRDRSRIYLEL